MPYGADQTTSMLYTYYSKISAPFALHAEAIHPTSLFFSTVLQEGYPPGAASHPPFKIPSRSPPALGTSTDLGRAGLGRHIACSIAPRSQIRARTSAIVKTAVRWESGTLPGLVTSALETGAGWL